ncbi:leucine--tRNA ligase [Patescibacteria group bacterium]|nr:leucine--tRNA ligase [Patescibacteria group bacterium]
MAAYDHKKIEQKWQRKWEETGIYTATKKAQGEKNYLLIEFPYPSGEGLHVGHVRSWTALDIVARKRRAEGKNVLYPIGWDAFGLPAENYALKTGIHPTVSTRQNVDNFRRQIKSLGLSFDWSREINTTDPSYYKWTQWLFLQFYKKGLAYKTKTLINWCPKDKIGLANEEVVDNCCERCGTPVEKREKEQWMLAITKYAKRLYDDLDTVDYIERAKVQQQNWIGPSEGAEISFLVARTTLAIKVFTTRPDTLFGATYLVLAPEHLLVKELAQQAENKDEVLSYMKAVQKKSEIDRTTEGKEKTGIEIKGIKAINPANKEEIPIYVADYVLGGYGTGAIMAVPAHDERDFDFAKKFGLPIYIVIEPTAGQSIDDTKPYAGEGTLVNSGEFTRMESREVKKKITEAVGGKWTTTYKLRDWVFSRQRYWGEPIPMVKCAKCALRDPSGQGWQPVPESELPVVLPQVEKYQPTDTGESPLANIPEFINTTCPRCGGPAMRETDVMPNWAGSSWYYLRYCDPHNDKEFASKKQLAFWTPVDWYNGGMEHTVLHLLYSRFWHKFLYDEGLVPTPEPYAKRTSHGLILAEGGEKMSKSRGNTVSPDDIVERYGADSLRLYEMFIGPFDQPVAWNTSAVAGSRRFLERAWKLQEKIETKGSTLTPGSSRSSLETLLHQTIKKVGEDIEHLKMNTAVSALMILLNEFEKLETVPRASYRIFLQLLAPFAPHIAHELAEVHEVDISLWPMYDAKKINGLMTKVAVQVNGKVRVIIELSREAPEDMALKKARTAAGKWLTGPEKRVVYVPGKIISFVVEEKVP